MLDKPNELIAANPSNTLSIMQQKKTKKQANKHQETWMEYARILMTFSVYVMIHILY